MILVAIGANLPDLAGRLPVDTCRWALAQLAEVARVEACSRWYQTAPVPASDQPDFTNGVARLAGTGDPYALLAALHAIEAAAGRTRRAPNAARVLDLDLLAVDQMVVGAASLTLPHPRLWQRAFVLTPLCDVAPGWCHPVLGKTALRLLADLNKTGVALASACPVD